MKIVLKMKKIVVDKMVETYENRHLIATKIVPTEVEVKTFHGELKYYCSKCQVTNVDENHEIHVVDPKLRL